MTKHPDLPLAARFVEALNDRVARSLVLTGQGYPETLDKTICAQVEEWYTQGRNGEWHGLVAPADLFIRFKVYAYKNCLAAEFQADVWLEVTVQVTFDRSLDVLPWTTGANKVTYATNPSPGVPRTPTASINELRHLAGLYGAAALTCDKVVHAVCKAAKAVKITMHVG